MCIKRNCAGKSVKGLDFKILYEPLAYDNFLHLTTVTESSRPHTTGTQFLALDSTNQLQYETMCRHSG